MKAGEYILDRFLPELVASAAAARGVACTSMSDGWVLRLARAEDVRWVVGYQFDLNTAAASALVQDKVAAHLALQQAGIASVPHVLIRSVPHEPIAVGQLEHLFPAQLVIKPLDGTGGRQVRRVASAEEAAMIIGESDEVAWAASPFYEIAAEYRVIVLDGQVLLAYEKTRPVDMHGMKFFNLGLGAVAAEIADTQVQEQAMEIAHEVCGQLGLRLAAVDIVRLSSGELLVLEVNDGIMMENYARQSPEYKDRVTRAYDAIVSVMFDQSKKL